MGRVWPRRKTRVLDERLSRAIRQMQRIGVPVERMARYLYCRRITVFEGLRRLRLRNRRGWKRVDGPGPWPASVLEQESMDTMQPWNTMQSSIVAFGQGRLAICTATVACIPATVAAPFALGMRKRVCDVHLQRSSCFCSATHENTFLPCTVRQNPGKEHPIPCG